MAWEIHSLGTNSLSELYAGAAEIITEKLGNCVYDSSSNRFTYDYGGQTYYVPAYSSSTKYDDMLFLNTDTGEFCLSFATTASAASNLGGFVHAGIFRLQVDEETTELAPIGKTSFSKQVYMIFSIGYPQSENTSNFLTLVPVVTLYQYTDEYNPVSRHQYKIVVNMFTSCVKHIAVGATIQVAGQDFICIAPALFVKM